MDSLKSYLQQGITFVQEAWSELSRVHYPSPREAAQAAAVVVLLSGLLALYLGLVDQGATWLVRMLLS